MKKLIAILSMSVAAACMAEPVEYSVKSSESAVGAVNRASATVTPGGILDEVVVFSDANTNLTASVTVTCTYAGGRRAKTVTTVPLPGTNLVGYASASDAVIPRGSTLAFVSDRTNRAFTVTYILK